MTAVRTCINVWSEMNEWIDFCIVLDPYEDTERAEEIINKAYDDWFTDESVTDASITLADYISDCLTENDIVHEIYFKTETEEEE